MGKDKPNPRGGGNQEKALELDRAHIEESTELFHKISLDLESSKKKEKKKIKEHITPRNGDRLKKNELKRKVQDRVCWRMLVHRFILHWE